ncbi:hypothetical protein JS756_22935 [Streptomyces actuosus]|uniref:WXG100 family type VII secretion target n=1 Tax=Streptomyces actuosus TaxID=1885 RepID=A0ABS2VUW6_STRAS|nr:hypothetical protein [Streptomyces actuosus]MBN0046917.1 hypothetical protein [Streptomyces actuosus]
MELNQLPADQGATSSGGSGGGVLKLRSDKAAWTKAGEDVGSIREDLDKAWMKTESGQTGLGKGTGCLTAAAQQDVYASWKRYVKDVGEVCDGLADVLEKAGNDQLRTDEAIKDELAKLRTDYYEDTPAGGQGKGR